jgi:hypothetical protein
MDTAYVLADQLSSINDNLERIVEQLEKLNKEA